MQVRAPLEDRYDEALTDDALALVGRLHEELDARRLELLDARQELQARLDAGESLDFVTAPEDFTVAPVPDALQDRRVEITGPTSRKMVINALNSGARGFMADFEDSNSPYWSNMIEGQVNLADAIRGSIEHSENGKDYSLGDDPAVLHVRPRGLHLPEAHLQLNGGQVAGAFMDFGLYVHRNAEALLERGWGPYFYIPKLESQHEAALWRDAFLIAEETLGLDRGTIKATVLIETIPAAFCMDAILYELRDHAAGLNAGRWDYIFSVIKRFRSRPEFVTPDRSAVTMTVPFMKAYSDLVVKTCSRARRPRDGRDGGGDPVAHGRGGEPQGVRGRAGGQAARGRERLRRHLGGAPGLGTGGDRGVRRGARRASQPGGQAARRRAGLRRGAPRRGLDARRAHRGGAALERQRRHPIPLVMAARQRRRRHLRPDGGRRDRRDRPRPGLAMDPPRSDARRRPHDHARSWSASWLPPSWRRSARRSGTTSGSRRKAARSSPAPSSSGSR